MTLIAAHQPNFFPWLGFFNKIWRCQRFVVLDDVQFEKSGHGSWVNRVKLAHRQDPYWVTLPVARAFSGTRTIAEMTIDNSRPWRSKLLKTVTSHYGKAAHFEEVFPLVEPLLVCAGDSLLEYNLQALLGLMSILDLDEGKLLRSSRLGVGTQATQRIVDLTLAAGGTRYLSGRVAMETYQDPGLFERAGVGLAAQEFQHPTYPRGTVFHSGLSILDPLFHCGREATRILLQGTNL